MKRVEFADYAVNVANAILEFDILKEVLKSIGLKSIGDNKISSSDKVIIKTIAEASNIVNDNMIAILTILLQIDKSKELRKEMSIALSNKLGSLNENMIQEKVKNSKDGLSIVYSLSILDSYIEYLNTGELDEEVLNNIVNTVNAKIKLRSLSNIINTVDFYAVNKNLIKDTKYKEDMSKILNNMTKEQLVNELMLAYKLISELK